MVGENIPVLIVDDDEDIREMLRDLLEETGYRVQEATDGLVALERLRASAEGMVVLLDLFMPQLDGSQVVEIVLDDSALAQRHAYVFMTARFPGLPAGLSDTLAAVGLPVIAKPIDFDELLSAVQSAAARLA